MGGGERRRARESFGPISALAGGLLELVSPPSFDPSPKCNGVCAL